MFLEDLNSALCGLVFHKISKYLIVSGNLSYKSLIICTIELKIGLGCLSLLLFSFFESLL